jgi:hypothetical protein
MKNESQNVTARQAWGRPALYRMDAADAQTMVSDTLNDGMNNKS